MENKTLTCCTRGETVKIVELNALDMRKRFIEFGFVRGSYLTIKRTSKHAILVSLGNSLLALDTHSASQILVETLI